MGFYSAISEIFHAEVEKMAKKWHFEVTKISYYGHNREHFSFLP